MIVGLRTWYAVRIVNAQQPAPVVIMQRKRVLDPMGSHRIRLDLSDAESDAPAIDQPITPVIEVEQAVHRFIGHG